MVIQFLMKMRLNNQFLSNLLKIMVERLMQFDAVIAYLIDEGFCKSLGNEAQKIMTNFKPEIIRRNISKSTK